MEWLPINFNLLKNPVNWAIVVLMVIIASFAFHLLLPGFYQNQPNS